MIPTDSIILAALAFFAVCFLHFANAKYTFLACLF